MRTEGKRHDGWVFGPYQPNPAVRARSLRRWGLQLLIGGLGATALTYFGNADPKVFGLPLMELACVAAGTGAGLLVLSRRVGAAKRP